MLDILIAPRPYSSKVSPCDLVDLYVRVNSHARYGRTVTMKPIHSTESTVEEDYR